MAAGNTNTVTILLSKPIVAYAEQLTELTLRPPTVKEMIDCGTAMRAGLDGTIAPDYAVCAALLSKICAIPPSSVEQLDPGDFDELSWQLLRFTRRSSAPADPASAG